jgi:cytochrome P450
MARHPESQEHIRDEITAVYGRANGAEPSIADLDSMTYTQAAFKVFFLLMVDLFVAVSDRYQSMLKQESLRLHPIVWQLGRVASRDDVIPLAFPITTESGEQVSSIPVKKGTIIDIATQAYQRYV